MGRALRTHPQLEKAPRASPRQVAGCFARLRAQVHTGLRLSAGTVTLVARSAVPAAGQPVSLGMPSVGAVPGSVREGRAHLVRPTLGRRLRIQSEMAKDLLDHRPLEDDGDDLKLPGAAVRAVLHVDVKAKLQRRLACTQVTSQQKTRLSGRAGPPRVDHSDGECRWRVRPARGWAPSFNGSEGSTDPKPSPPPPRPTGPP